VLQNVGEPLFGIEVVETTGGKEKDEGIHPANLFRCKKKKEILNKK